MGEEVINAFIMTAKDFHVHQTFNQPIMLDTQRYNYFLRLLQVQFSNVVPNVEYDLYVKVGGVETKVVSKGVYEIEELIDAFNALGVGKMELDANVGKITITNDTGSAITFTKSDNHDFLSSEMIGFSTSQYPITLNNNESITASNNVKIQHYNYFVLSSGNINGITYTSIDENNIKPSNILYPFSSALKPFQFKTWTAILPVEFKLYSNVINYLDFELKDANDRPLNNLMSDSDFMVYCQIVKQRKMN